MKKTNYLFAGILALGLLASCNNEEVMGGSQGSPGEEAVATFRIRIGNSTVTKGALTRAVAGTAAENKLTLLDLLVFDNNKSDDVSTPSDDATLESISSVAIPAEGGAVTAKVVTETGKKIVVAVANNDPKGTVYFAYNNGMTWKAFKELKVTNAAVLPADGVKATLNLVSDKGFLMVSDPFFLNVTKEGPNTATLSLERLSAKVQVAVPNPLGTGGDFPADVTVTFNAPLYLPFQYQTLASPLMPIMSDGIKDVIEEDKAGAGDDDGQLKKPARTVTSHLQANMPKGPEDYYTPGRFAANVEPDWGNAPDNMLYVSENIMAQARPTRNYITSLLVKLDFADVDYSNDDTGTGNGFNVVYQFKSEADAIAKNANAVIAMKGVYKDAEKADEVAQKAGADHAVIPFANPTGYYRVDLKNRDLGTLPQIYSIVRNTYYQVKLTAVNSFGWPNPEDLTKPDDNTEPGENLVEISTEVSIADWVDIDQNEELK